jgi:MFS family permease
MTSPRFPGRLVLTAAFVLLTFSSGVGFYGLSVYLQAFSRELGWSVASISSATTFFFLVGGLSAITIAKFVAKYDVRIVVLVGAVLGAGSLLCMRLVSERWHLFVVYGAYALGWSASGLGPVTTVVTRWFAVKRAGALAIASTGLSVGGIVVTPVVKWILDTRGIDRGSPWLAAIWFVGIVPVTVLFLRPFPHLYGWLPDGERAAEGAAPRITGTPMAVAIRSRFFLMIAIGYIFAFGAQVGGVQQLVKMVEERTDRATATLGTVVLSTFAIIARFAVSRAIAQLDMTRFTVLVAVVQAVSLAIIGVMNTSVGLLVGIALFGCTIGNMLMMQSLLVAQRFGVLDYPRIAARQGLISFTGTAAGPLLLGVLHDFAGGYRASYLAAGACSLTGALLFSFAGSANPPAGEHV